jgi:hypothetical protein
MNTLLNTLHWGYPETIAVIIVFVCAVIGWFAHEIDNAVLVDENEMPIIEEHEEALF